MWPSSLIKLYLQASGQVRPAPGSNPNILSSPVHVPSSALQGRKLNQKQLPSQNYHDTPGASYHARWGCSSHHSLLLQNQLVSYADGSAAMISLGPTPRSPNPKRKISAQLRKEKLSWALGHLGQQEVSPDTGRVEQGTNSSELTTLVPGKVPGDTPPKLLLKTPMDHKSSGNPTLSRV